jgi:hypothetical protein
VVQSNSTSERCRNGTSPNNGYQNICTSLESTIFILLSIVLQYLQSS